MNKVVDNYVFLEKLGAGQFAEVYKGKDRFNDNTVAIKVYSLQKFANSPKLKEMMLNEIKALSELNCPNIIHYHKMLKTTNNIYLIYEYCDAKTLEDYIIKKKFLNEKEALHFLKQLAAALKEMIAKNVVHRDIKPSNILLTSAGILKLADFGLCKFLDPSQEQMAKLEAILNNVIYEKNFIVGSPIYMAPELLKGQSVNKKSDLYSTGIVLYEMLFGVCPFEDTNVENLLQKIEKSTLHFPLDRNPISQKTQNLLKNLLQADPNKRLDWEQFFAFFEENLTKFEQTFENSTNNNISSYLSDNYRKSPKEEAPKLGVFTDNFANITKKLLKEKNKIVYLSNVVSATLDLNLNNLSVLAIIALLKLQFFVYEGLIDTLNQDIPKENANKTLKTSYEEWLKFKRSDEQRIFSRILQDEYILLKENYVKFIAVLQANQLKIEMKLLEMSRETINEILYFYCKTLQAHFFELLSVKENELAKKIVIHANNVLDAMEVDDFFEKFINEDVLEIEKQSYFEKMMSFSLEKCMRMVAEKLDFFSKIIKK